MKSSELKSKFKGSKLFCFIESLHSYEITAIQFSHFAHSFSKKNNRVDEEIISSVYKQSRAGVKGKQELERAKNSIQDLFAKIREIKRKASESEQMVQDICRDIRDLDFAKKNLTTSMTALKRLHDLSNFNSLQNFHFISFLKIF